MNSFIRHSAGGLHTHALLLFSTKSSFRCFRNIGTLSSTPYVINFSAHKLLLGHLIQSARTISIIGPSLVRGRSNRSEYLSNENEASTDKSQETEEPHLNVKTADLNEEEASKERQNVEDPAKVEKEGGLEFSEVREEETAELAERAETGEQLIQKQPLTDAKPTKKVQGTKASTSDSGSKDGSIIERLRKLSMTDVSRYSKIDELEKPIEGPKNVDKRLLKLVSARNKLKSFGGGDDGYDRYNDNYSPPNRYGNYGNDRYSRNNDYDDRRPSPYNNARQGQRYSRREFDNEEGFADDDDDADFDQSSRPRSASANKFNRPSYNNNNNYNRQRYSRRLNDDEDEDEVDYGSDDKEDSRRKLRSSSSDMLNQQAQLRRGAGSSSNQEYDRSAGGGGPRGNYGADDEDYEQIVKNRFSQLKRGNTDRTAD